MKKQTRIKILLLFVVILCAILFLLLRTNSEPFDSNVNSQLKVFIYENSMDETRTHNLEKLLSKFDYDYEVLGKGDVWNGWYGRAQKYIESLNNCDEDTYVLFLDGRDVIPNKSKDDFMRTAVNACEPDKIVFNAESACCNVGSEFNGTESERHNHIEQIKQHFKSIKGDIETEYAFLNFGIMFGKCKNFKNMFSIMNMKPGDDDQGLITQKIMNGEFENYKLDYNNELFGIMFDEPRWDDERKMYYNPNNSAYPSFFHFPGKTKWYETCIKQLFHEHLNDNVFL